MYSNVFMHFYGHVHVGVCMCVNMKVCKSVASAVLNYYMTLLSLNDDKDSRVHDMIKTPY